MKKLVLILIAIMLFSIGNKAAAQSFGAVNGNGDTIMYNIISSTFPFEVEVTQRGSNGEKYVGAILIPSSVVYNSTTYSVTKIGDYVFYDNSGLTSISIPSSIVNIGQSAFVGCISLSTINIDSSNPAFTSEDNFVYSKLKDTLFFCPTTKTGSIIIPNTVKSIGYGAFYYCNGITSITIPSSVKSIGYVAFEGCSSLNSISLPNSITSMGNNTFWGCTSLVSITLSDSLTTIPWSCFANCTSLQSITIPNSVTNIEARAFWGCTSLSSLIIPNSVTSIGGDAFWSCTALSSITIPSSVTSIGYFVFGYSGIQNIIFKSNLPIIEGWYFGLDNDDNIFVPCGQKQAYRSATGWGDFLNIYGENDVFLQISDTINGGQSYNDFGFNEYKTGQYRKELTMQNGCDSVIFLDLFVKPLISIIGGDTLYYSVTSNIAPYTLEVTYAGEYYHSFNEYLDTITIPSSVLVNNITYSVTSIGNYAFANSFDLKYLNIPNTITHIGDNAFYNCYNIRSLTIPSSVSSIGNYAFQYCSLDSIYFPHSYPPTISWGTGLPYNVTLIVSCIAKPLYLASDYWNWINDIRGDGDIRITIFDTISSGQSYNQYGYNATESGVYTVKNPMIGGCDSVIILNLTVSPLVSISNGDTIFYKVTSNISPYTVETTFLGNSYYDVSEYHDSIIIPPSITVNSITYAVTAIGCGTFGSNYDLRYVVIPNTITQIKDNSFASCYNLKSMVITSSVQSIGQYAFNNTGLDYMYLEPINPPILSYGSINSYLPIFVSCAAKPQYLSSQYWSDFIDIRSLGDSIVDIYDTITTGNTYILYGFNEHLSGDYTRKIPMANGCDSILNLHLKVNPFFDISNGDTIYYYITSNVEPYSVEVTYFGNNYSDFNEYRDSLIIPSSVIINNITYFVTAIGNNAFAECNNLESVILPSTLTNIGDGAFQYCSSLKNITIPTSVTSIGYYPFTYSGVNYISMLPSNPPTLTYGLGVNTQCPIYVSCSSKSLYLNAPYWSWSSNIRGDNDILINIYDTITTGQTYTNYGFNLNYSGNYNNNIPMTNGCDSIINLFLTVEPIKSIYNGDTIYYNITSNTEPLTLEVTYYGENYYTINEYSDTIAIPSSVMVGNLNYSVTSIGDNAFRDCYYLKSLEIPSTITNIGYSAFSNSGLEKLTLLPSTPPNVMYLGINYNTSIYVDCNSKPQYLSSNNWNWMNINGLSDTIIYIYDTITTGNIYSNFGISASQSGEYIGRVPMLNGCDSVINLNLVVLPLKSIKNGDTIYYNITSNDSPKTVEVTYSGTNYNSIKEYRDTIIIPPSIMIDSTTYYVTAIGNDAFRECNNLTSVIMPNTIIRIGESAFRDCYIINRITIPPSVTMIDYDAFSNSGTNELRLEPIIPPSMQWGGGLWNQIPIYVACQAKQNYMSSQYWNWFTNFIGDNDTTINLYDTINTGQIYNQYGLYVTRTGNYISKIPMINGCDSILNIHIYVKPLIVNNGINNIYYNITNYNPNTVEVTYFGEDPYDNNEYIGTITIPDSITINNMTFTVTSIGQGAFAGCNQLTSVSLPNSVSLIAENSFENCSTLTSITIPYLVSNIGNYAFSGSGLQEINMLPTIPPTIGWDLGVDYSVPIYVSCLAKPQYNSAQNWSWNYNISGVGDVNIHIFDTITTGQVYNKNGFTEYYSGDYSMKFPMINGCDSVFNLHLMVEPLKTIINGDTIYYNITSNQYPRTVEVTYLGRDFSSVQEYRDTIVVPPSFMIDTITYNVTSIGNGAFAGNNSLKYVVLPNTVVSLYENAFNYCPNIKYLIIPSSVGFLGYDVFGQGLEGIRFEPQTPPHLHWGSGMNSNLPINVTCISKQAYLNSSEWTMFNNIVGDGDTIINIFDTITTGQVYTQFGFNEMFSGDYSRNVSMINGCDSTLNLHLNVIPLMHINDGDSIYYNITSNVSPYTVEVTYLGSYFYSTREYKDTINIPNNITIDTIIYNVVGIGQEAFRDCVGLKAVIIPNSISYIRQGAFQNCRGIKSLTIPSSVNYIGEYVFKDNGLSNLRFEPIIPPTFDNDPGFDQNVLLNVTCPAKPNYVVITPWPQSVIGDGDISLHYYDKIPTGQFYTQFGLNVNRTGDYRITKPTGNGCDSVFNIHLIVNPLIAVIDGDTIYFNIISNVYPRTVEVTYFGASPDSYNEYRDTISIPPFFIIDTIQYNVISIGSGAFANSNNLTWVNIPNSITHIGDISFNNCQRLRNLIIPSSVNMIGYSAFDNAGLINLYVQAQTPPFVHWHSGINQSVNLYVPCNSKQQYLSSFSWNYINNIIGEGDVEIPIFDTISLGQIYSQYGFNASTTGKYTIPLSTIGGCDSTLVLNLVVLLPVDTFSVVNQGKLIYYRTSPIYPNVVEVTYRGNDENQYMDEYSGDVVIPPTVSHNSINYFVKIIGKSAFNNCSSLTSIEFPNSLRMIDNYAFKHCTGLTKVRIPDSTMYIGEGAFELCTNIDSLFMPRKLKMIGNSAFSSCMSLDFVVFFGELEYIGELAFSGCSGINSIYSIANFPPNINTNTFAQIPTNTPLFVPCGSKFNYQDSYWNSFTDIRNIFSDTINIYETINQGDVYADNGFYESNAGLYTHYFNNIHGCDSTVNLFLTVLQDIDTFSSVYAGNNIYYRVTSAVNPYTVEVTFRGDSPSAYPNEYSGLVSIPSTVLRDTIMYSVTALGNNAFNGCTGLTSLNYTNSVTRFGDYVFANCIGLTSFNIQGSTVDFGSNIFDSCIGLANITVDTSNAEISSVDGIIYSNDKDEVYFCPMGKTGVVSLPNTVNMIDKGAFSSCSKITSLIIPSSVNDIREYAFYGCSGLNSLTIKTIAPPVITNSSFGNVPKTIPLYVPCGSINNYKSSPNWNSFTNIHSSDSLFTILNATICQGQSYTLNGFNEDSTGVYTKNLQTINGCDSIVTLNLITNPSYTLNIYDTIYLGETYNTFGFTKDSAGVFTQNLQTIKGCDSIIILNLAVKQLTTNISGTNIYYRIISNVVPYTVEVTYKGNHYVQYENEYVGVINIPSSFINNSKTYLVTAIGTNAFRNCANLTQVTIPNSVYSIGDAAFAYCNNLSNVSIIDSTLTTISSSAFQGCTNLVTINIPNSVSTIGSLAFKACSSLPSINIPSSLTTISYGSFSECSSLNYAIIPNTVTFIGTYAFGWCSNLDSIKMSNNVTWFDYGAFYECTSLLKIDIPSTISVLNNAAFYNCTSLSSIRCNSVNPPTAYTNTFYNVPKNIPVYVPCTSKSLYISAQYWNAFTNIQGNGNVNKQFTATICQGQSYTLNGFNVDSTGVYTQNLQTINGCDSIVTLNLTVNPTYLTPFTATICKGQSYTLNGFNEDSTGVYTQNLQTINGCDSIVTLNLTVNPTYLTPFTATICQGQSYTLNGFNEDSTGVYTQNLQTINGCDSIVTLNLTVTPTYLTPFTATICQGQNYTLNGFNEDSTGLYTHTLQTINGCDSIVTLNLTVNPTYLTPFTATICQGQSYTLNGFNEDSTGVYTQSLQTINGCDSIVTLNLTVNPSYSVQIFDTICMGETYIDYGFNEDSTGVYVQSLQSTNGCDSIITLNLYVDELIVPNNLTLANIANYIQVSWDGSSPSYIIYRNNDSLAYVSSNVFKDSTVVDGVNYCYKVKAINDNCESALSIENCLTFVGLEDDIKNPIYIQVYPNPANNRVRIELDGVTKSTELIIYDMNGRIVRTINLNPYQKQLELDISTYAKGIYNVKLLNNEYSISKKLIIQ